jgi:maleylpyruvate isomerase
MGADRQHLTDSTDSLLRTLDGLTEEQVREGSALPGWTRGHVLTHLARNADAMGNLVRWAVSGVRTPMYPSSQARNADIDAGATRPAPVIVADVVASADRLATAIEALIAAGPDALARPVVFGPVQPDSVSHPAARIVSHRRREVEVHHADLGAGYQPLDWPEDFVRETLEGLSRTRCGAAGLAGITALVAEDGTRWSLVTEGGGHAAHRDLIGPAVGLATWLLGRDVQTALTTSDGSPVPAPPGM